MDARRPFSVYEIGAASEFLFFVKSASYRVPEDKRYTYLYHAVLLEPLRHPRQPADAWHQAFITSPQVFEHAVVNPVVFSCCQIRLRPVRAQNHGDRNHFCDG